MKLVRVLKPGFKLCPDCGAVMEDFDLGPCEACKNPEVILQRIFPNEDNAEIKLVLFA
jgi:hypothetical protein